MATDTSTTVEQPPPVDAVVREEAIVRDTFEFLGRRVVVGATEGQAHQAVRKILRGFGPVATGPDPTLPLFELVAKGNTGWLVRMNGEIVDSCGAFSTSLTNLEWQLTNAAIEERQDLFHLHGAALCAPLQRAGLVIIGDSGQGKTTLTLALMLRGFVPYTDDVSLLDPETLELQPLRRSFHVKNEHVWQLLEPIAGPMSRDEGQPPGFFTPPQWAEQRVPVRWVLFMERRFDVAPTLIPMSPAEAAAAILAQTLSLKRTPRLALSVTARLTAEARCFRFISGDLATSVELLQQLVGARSPEDASPSQ